MTIDIKQIEAAIKNNDSAQVQNLLQQFFAQDISDDDKAAAHVMLVKTYMQIMNDLQLDYKNKLQKATRLMEQADTVEQNMSAQIKIKEEISQL